MAGQRAIKAKKIGISARQIGTVLKSIDFAAPAIGMATISIDAEGNHIHPLPAVGTRMHISTCIRRLKMKFHRQFTSEGEREWKIPFGKFPNRHFQTLRLPGLFRLRKSTFVFNGARELFQ
jgi:REP element-mobilizing transposase RayT